MNGSLVSGVGQASIRSQLTAGESVSYRGVAIPQILTLYPSSEIPTGIMVMASAGVVPPVVALDPIAVQSSQAIMPVTSGPVPAMLPVLLPQVSVPVATAKELFKDAIVSSEILKVASPEAFANVSVFSNIGTPANFKGISVSSVIQ
jgi:hypothetical protein